MVIACQVGCPVVLRRRVDPGSSTVTVCVVMLLSYPRHLTLRKRVLVTCFCPRQVCCHSDQVVCEMTAACVTTRLAGLVELQSMCSCIDSCECHYSLPMSLSALRLPFQAVRVSRLVFWTNWLAFERYSDCLNRSYFQCLLASMSMRNCSWRLL